MDNPAISGTGLFKLEKTSAITYKKLAMIHKGFLFVRLSAVIYFVADEIARENCLFAGFAI